MMSANDRADVARSHRRPVTFGWKSRLTRRLRKWAIGVPAMMKLRPTTTRSTPARPRSWKGNRVSSVGDTRLLWVGVKDAPTGPATFPDNRVVSSKYTVWNFLPKNLLEQFRRVANFYFLCISVIALSIEDSPVSPVSSVLPLIFVILVTAFKQSYEDWLRHRADKEVNCTLVTVIRNGIVTEIESQQVRVGDLVRIVSDSDVPCDLVLLSSSDPGGKCHVTTANLDGETNLKTLVCPRLMQRFSRPEQLAKLKAQIECEQPTPDLYKFYGKLEVFPEEGDPGGTDLNHHSSHTNSIVITDNEPANACLNTPSTTSNKLNGFLGRATVVSNAMNFTGDANHKRSSTTSNKPNGFLGRASVVSKTSSFTTDVGLKRSSTASNKHSGVTRCASITSNTSTLVSETMDVASRNNFNRSSIRYNKEGGVHNISSVVENISNRISVTSNNSATVFGVSDNGSSSHRISVKSNGTNVGSDRVSILSNRNRVSELGRTAPLGTENLLLRGARLKNTEYVHGCAVYTGQETKLALNSKVTSNKFSTVEKAINKYLLFFLCLLIFEVGLSLGLKYWIEMQPEFEQKTYLGRVKKWDVCNVVEYLLSFFILYNYIIPISLYVTIEMQKFLGTLFFKWDSALFCYQTGQAAICNTSDLNEELGQVQYLFTDKTGTLTENNMWFRRCSVGGQTYLESNGTLFTLPPSGDVTLGVPVTSTIPEMEQFLLALALCHSVQVSVRNSANNNMDSEHLDYQASSPDEKALVEASARCGIVFLGEKGDTMFVRVREHVCHYVKLDVFEFTSERKRMSVLVRDEEGGIWLICKGAESAILPLVTSGPKQEVLNHVEDFANRGLRTMVAASRRLESCEYLQLSDQVDQARQTMSSKRESVVAEQYHSIETGLTLLGATGVEDQLQEGVQETLESLRAAGIKVWILTGDKVETAVNISRSCGHFKAGTVQLTLTGLTSQENCEAKLKQFRTQMWREHHQQYGLVVDGLSLAHALKFEELFRVVCMHCTAVVCCRMTPLQKSEVVLLVKSSPSKPITAAIGDGANDVSMIQEAHVGLGIMGKEGRQAVRCSDFAYARFRFTRQVLLVHGHWYYLRIATLVQYFFYKNIVFIMPQLYYAFHNLYSTQPLYDSMFLMCYNIFFTSLPILIYGLFEQNYTASSLLRFPQLYTEIRSNALMTWSCFFQWTALGLWHSVVLYFLPWYLMQLNPVLLSNNSPADLWAFGTLIFHCVTCVTNLRLWLHSRYWTMVFLGSIFLSIFGFIGFGAAYSAIYLIDNDMYYVYLHLLASPTFWLISLMLVILCLIPDYTVIALKPHIDSLLKKIRKVRCRKKHGYNFSRSVSYMDSGCVTSLPQR